jgi:hypothetical protein
LEVLLQLYPGLIHVGEFLMTKEESLDPVNRENSAATAVATELYKNGVCLWENFLFFQI